MSFASLSVEPSLNTLFHRDLLPDSAENNSLPPSWLRWFVNDASRGILDHGSTAPVGCHFFHDTELDLWEVTLFVSRTEVVGGPQDGSVISNGVQVDIGVVLQSFDSLPECYWQSEAIHSDDQLGNHLSLEGVARGQRVWLRIVHEAPAWTGPGRLMHARQGIIEDLW
jgi:hypothetical protein